MSNPDESLLLLPTPAHIQADSMLARRFGKETVNYFGGISCYCSTFRDKSLKHAYPGSPINRLSFLRTDHQFLGAAVRHPSTRFLLLKELEPLIEGPNSLYYAKYKDIQNLVPPTVFDKSEEELIKEYDSRITKPDLIFLGVDETAADSVQTEEELFEWNIYKGRPLFALDVSEKGNNEQKAHAKSVIEELGKRGITPFASRIHQLQPPSHGMCELIHLAFL